MQVFSEADTPSHATVHTTSAFPPPHSQVSRSGRQVALANPIQANPQRWNDAPDCEHIRGISLSISFFVLACLFFQPVCPTLGDMGWHQLPTPCWFAPADRKISGEANPPLGPAPEECPSTKVGPIYSMHGSLLFSSPDEALGFEDANRALSNFHFNRGYIHSQFIVG